MVIPILAFLLLASLVVLGVVTWFYLKNLGDFKEFEAIEDKQKYLADCEHQSNTALKAAQQSKLQLVELKKEIKRNQHVVKRLEKVYAPYKKLQGLDELIVQKKAGLQKIQQKFDLANNVGELSAQAQFYENLVAELKQKSGDLQDAFDLQEFGYYTPRYDFETSAEFKKKLEAIKLSSKQMLKRKTACTCDTEWTVEGSKAKGAKMVNEQIKLMLRAFNGEADASIAKVKYDNAVTLEKRISNSFSAINKLGGTKQIFLSKEYLNLRLEELHLSHEYRVKKQEEKEEQARIREMMREEEKVHREIEKAKKDAENEEELKRNALDSARRELRTLEGENTRKMQLLVQKLEAELKEALDRKAKAIARAQLTKSGHVYILSNVGAFGEDVYKIGLTRRLDPSERVKELGSASVPFPFDVHAMIYTEDAPTLERSLHKYFDSRRVNLVNSRKEFFKVSLSEIRQAVGEIHGDVTFALTAEAQQYRETIALMRESSSVSMQLA